MADGVQIRDRPDLSFASIMARRGASAAAIGQATGVDIPIGPAWAAGEVYDVVASGPGMWLAWGRGADCGWCAELERRLSGLASVVDQTGAFRVIHLEGAKSRTLLQRGAAIDLDASRFGPGCAAHTMIGHIDVLIRCLPEAESFEVAVSRSFAESFIRWIDAAVAGL